jgi:hypothetical protein
LVEAFSLVHKKFIKRLHFLQSMPRGRPIKSEIRQNIIEILYFLKKGYGYDIYRHYKEVFPAVTMRVIYYHLKKGVDVGEFKINQVIKEEGDFSWGNSVEKIYYELGENAKPTINSRVKEHFEKKSLVNPH